MQHHSLTPGITRILFTLSLFALLLAPSGPSGTAHAAAGTGRACVTDYQAAFTVQSDWGSGFTGEIAITNRGTQRINAWRLEFEFDRQIGTIWNARVVERTGRHHVVEGDSWNSWLEPGGRVTFGFTAAPGGEVPGPTGYRLTGELPPPPPTPGGGGGSGGTTLGAVQIRYATESDWGSGFVGRIDLTNTGATPVNDWILEFDFGRALTSVWNARVLSRAGDHYRVGPEFYNRSIPAGGTISIGFVGTPGNVTTGAQNLALNRESTLQAIEIAPAFASLAPGQSRAFTATGAYSDGTTRDLTTAVTWTSSAPSVAAVTVQGTATALAAGQAVLRAVEARTGLQAAATVSVAAAGGGTPGPVGRTIVMGYVETLRSGGSADILRLNYDAVDVLIHGFAVPLADGRIDVSQGNFADYRAHGLVTEAHRRGKRVLVSLGGAVGSTHFAAIAASPALRDAFARNLVELVRTYGYDGIDIDDEFPVGPQQTREFTLLMQAVYAAVKANNPQHLAIFGASPGYYIDSDEWDQLAACSDYALVFGYDWKNPANGPMTNPGQPQWTAQNNVIEASVRGALNFALQHGYPASKIVMGLPFYGTNNVSWSSVRSLWAAQAPMTPHPQWMEVQLGNAWFTSPEAIRMKMDAVLLPGASVLNGGATLAGVGFWEFGHEAPAQPDLSRAIGDWVRAHPR